MLGQYLTWSPTFSLTLPIWIVVRILKNKPTSFSIILKHATSRRLDRLLTETAYGNEDSDLTFDEKLEIRRIAAILAATLWKHYKSSDSIIPCVVEKWREVCLSPDEFSEIRNVWKNCESL
jgi:hypothetical protein